MTPCQPPCDTERQGASRPVQLRLIATEGAEPVAPSSSRAGRQRAGCSPLGHAGEGAGRRACYRDRASRRARPVLGQRVRRSSRASGDRALGPRPRRVWFDQSDERLRRGSERRGGRALPDENAEAIATAEALAAKLGLDNVRRRTATWQATHRTIRVPLFSATGRRIVQLLAVPVETKGLEPSTPCLQSRRSSQLSYVPWLTRSLGLFVRLVEGPRTPYPVTDDRPASPEGDLGRVWLERR